MFKNTLYVVAAFCCVASWAAIVVAESADDDEDATEQTEKPKEKTLKKEYSPDGLGMQVRGAHIEGQGVPQAESITPIELFPFFLIEDELFFSDLRFFSTNELELGGNVGFGYRHYSRDFDRVFGISGWYDADGTRDEYLQQLGLSLETYAGPFDFRTNLYLPIGETSPEIGTTVVSGSTQFEGDSIVYDQVRSLYAAMRGFDMEAGIPIPGDFADDHGIRIYGGGYHFVADDGETITGGSGRIQANIVEGLDAEVQVTHDGYNDTQAFVGVSWTFGPLHRSQYSPSNSRMRLGEHVTRNYTVLAPNRKYRENDIVAVDPATGNPYRVAHVDSEVATGGNGAVNNPFETIAQAQAANKDIIFVHAGSVFQGADATVVLADGERLLGDGSGANHFVEVRDIGRLLLPHGPTAGAAPILNSSVGNAMTLSSNSEFSNFSITNSAGAGLFGNGVQNAVVRNVAISGSGADGIRLNDSHGILTFDGMSVAASGADALHIDGGDAAITFAGTLSAGTGHHVEVAETLGGSVDLTAAETQGSGGEGVLLRDNAGDVTLRDVALAGTSGTGIQILSGSGSFNFEGTTSVDAAAGNSVEIHDLGSDGSVTFANLDVTNRLGRGVSIGNVSGSVEVTGATRISNEAGATTSAIDIRNSSGEMTFGHTDVVDATGNAGVQLQDNTGTTTFRTLDISAQNGTALAASSGGTLVINGDQLADGGTISAVNGTAIDIAETELNVNLTSVSSSTASVGLRLVDTTGVLAVWGEGSDGSGGTIQNVGTGIFLQNVESAGIAWMTLDYTGVGIHSENVNYLDVRNTALTHATSYGIDALNTRTLVLANSALQENGAENLRARFDQVASYAYTIDHTSLISETGDNIVLNLLAGGAGSSGNFTVTSSVLENSFAGSSGVKIDWNGTLSTTFEQNSFAYSGGSNNGVRIVNSATASPTTVTWTTNAFTSTGGSDTALRLTAAGATQLAVVGNVIQFGANNGTGLRLNLGASSAVNINGNTIADGTDGMTSILFESIAGPSSVIIQDNLLSHANNGGLLDQGIVFSSVTDDTVTLYGTQNNAVYGTDSALVVPVGMTTGSILVNGIVAP